MAIPPTAVVWAEVMDPSDNLDFTVDCTDLLDTGDSIQSYTLAPGPEGTLLGLTIGTMSQNGNVITLWLSIDPSDQQSTSFDGAGTTLPVVLTLTTVQGRKRQRTLVVKVAQR